MATLEMVPLRSMYPNSGRVTLRFTMPPFDIDLSEEAPLREAGQQEASLREAVQEDQTTTPQVAQATEPEGETTVRKGGQAR
jgi:hypothetical protein